jgi:phosphinothricin acetyltransferase
MPPAAQRSVIVRPCFQQDLEVVQLIYAHHVMTGAGTFEIEPPSLQEMTDRWSKVVTHGWPFLVASPTHDLSRVLGYAYAQPFRERAAYAQTFEDSIYVAPSSQRQGVGALLLSELLRALRHDGVREVLGVIGDSGNAGSIGLHQKAGFRHVGVFKDVGFKFGRWFDVVLMQRSFAPTTPPQAPE